MVVKRGIGVVFTLLLLSAIILPLVSAAEGDDATIGDRINSFIAGIFSNSSISVNPFIFQQILLFFLVALILYAIGEFLPFTEGHSRINGAIALIVSALATFYLKKEEVANILLSYGALGVVLTAIIPFFAVAVIAKRSYDKGYPFMGKVLWIAFGVVLVFRWLGAKASDLGVFAWVYPVVLGIVIIMLIADRWIYFRMFKLTMSGEVDQSRRLYIGRLMAQYQQALDEESEAKTPEAERAAKARVDNLRKKIDQATAAITP